MKYFPAPLLQQSRYSVSEYVSLSKLPEHSLLKYPTLSWLN